MRLEKLKTVIEQVKLLETAYDRLKEEEQTYLKNNETEQAKNTHAQLVVYEEAINNMYNLDVQVPKP